LLSRMSVSVSNFWGALLPHWLPLLCIFHGWGLSHHRESLTSIICC
jgi:hypothetical protein